MANGRLLFQALTCTHRLTYIDTSSTHMYMSCDLLSQRNKIWVVYRLLDLEFSYQCKFCVIYFTAGLSGTTVFQECTIDWRFFEFRSAATFTLFTVSLECLAIPAAGNTIGSLLLESLLTRYITELMHMNIMTFRCH